MVYRRGGGVLPAGHRARGYSPERSGKGWRSALLLVRGPWHRLGLPVRLPVAGAVNSPTQRVELTRGYHAIIDAADADAVGRHKWCADVIGGRPYAASRINGKNTRLHRFLMGNPAGVVDHINGDALDNRRANLRVCTIKENVRNQARKDGRLKGVTRSKGKWTARLMVDGRNLYLGLYGSPEAAAQAYDAAARQHFGEYARCNFV
jgi:hypothetical protein